MPTSATIVRFPVRHLGKLRLGKLRPVKVRPSPDVRLEVRRLVTLAPVLGEQNPTSVASVVRYVCRLIPDPPPLDGLEADVEMPRAVAACGSRMHPDLLREGGVRMAFLKHVDTMQVLQLIDPEKAEAIRRDAADAAARTGNE